VTGSAARAGSPAIAAATTSMRTKLTNRMRQTLTLAGLVRKTRIFVHDQVWVMVHNNKLEKP
jgi:hypothetical protein